jgi:hypothetical protein
MPDVCGVFYFIAIKIFGPFLKSVILSSDLD